MEALEQLAATAQSAAYATRAAFARPLLAVWLAATLAPALVAVVLVRFAHPAWSGMLEPVVHRLGGEAALHYPGTLRTLPAMLATLALATGWLVTPVLVGWAATIAARRDTRARAALATTLGRLPRWLVAGTPLVVAHDAIVRFGAAALASAAHRPVGAAGSVLVALVLDAVVLAIGACMLPALVRDDARLGELPETLRLAPSWQGAGAAGFGAALATTGLVARIVADRVQQGIAGAVPDAAPALALAVAAVGALGVVTFAAGAVVMGAALDDRWHP